MHELKERVFEICQPFLDYCSSLGEGGLFILSFVESSFFPIPPDFLYIPMIINGHPHPYNLAFVATVGSVLGALLGYYIGLLGGRPLASKFLKHEHLEKAHELFEKYGSIAILLAAFTPLPFKVFTIAAGIAKMRKRELIISSILGRGGRFFLVTYLLVSFGQSMIDNFVLITSVGGLLFVSIYLFLAWLKKYKKTN